MTVLLISDLHLHPSRPEAIAGFYRFLEEQASDVEALYILGDFFDSWIGDDDDQPLNAEVAAALNTLSRRGTRIFIMHGNRDFLLGQDFAARAGATLLDDPSVINLAGEPTVLLHGDSLCTGDIAYMAMRQQLRSDNWQTEILSQPLSARRALAEQLRLQSKTMNSIKAEDIMDVTEDAVTELLRQTGTHTMIHGHTHRPAEHTIDLDGQPATRWVLGDWHDHGWCLRADDDGLRLESWPL